VKGLTSFVVGVSFLLLAGCAVGPKYKRPQVSIPKQWTVAPARGTSIKPGIKESEPRPLGSGLYEESPLAHARGSEPTHSFTDDWWSSFQDPELNSLIERAVSRNLDLKLALERIQEARAARGIAASGYFPSIDANASATRLRGGINQGVVRAVPSSADPKARPSLISPFETTSFQGNLSASWELDVFGGIGRGVQAAAADAVAAEENRRDVIVILLGDVSRVYAQLRGFQRRLEIANKNIKTQQETLDLTTVRAKAGLATELDVSRAAAQLQSTKAVVPTLLSGIDASIHRLSVLLAEEPGALRSELETAIPIPNLQSEIRNPQSAIQNGMISTIEFAGTT